MIRLDIVTLNNQKTTIEKFDDIKRGVQGMRDDVVREIRRKPE